MVDAHILDGDIAIIRPQSRVENGEIAAVMVTKRLPEATLKRVRYTKASLILEAANPDYKTMIFRGLKRRDVKILGRYVGVVRRG
jgi:repressor LexA